MLHEVYRLNDGKLGVCKSLRGHILTLELRDKDFKPIPTGRKNPWNEPCYTLRVTHQDKVKVASYPYSVKGRALKDELNNHLEHNCPISRHAEQWFLTHKDLHGHEVRSYINVDWFTETCLVIPDGKKETIVPMESLLGTLGVWAEQLRKEDA